MRVLREETMKFEQACFDRELRKRLQERTEREAVEALLSLSFPHGQVEKIEKILLNA